MSAVNSCLTLKTILKHRAFSLMVFDKILGNKNIVPHCVLQGMLRKQEKVRIGL